MLSPEDSLEASVFSVAVAAAKPAISTLTSLLVAQLFSAVFVLSALASKAVADALKLVSVILSPVPVPNSTSSVLPAARKLMPL
jgi:hypothetical protein